MDLIVDSHFGDGDVRLRQLNSYQDIFAKVSDLTMVKPTFDVGDRVTWSSMNGEDCYTGTVLSIAEDHLWVSFGDGGYATVWTGKAMRVEPEPKQPEIIEPPEPVAAAPLSHDEAA